jgi:hypothetical protein
VGEHFLDREGVGGSSPSQVIITKAAEPFNWTAAFLLDSIYLHMKKAAGYKRFCSLRQLFAPGQFLFKVKGAGVFFDDIRIAFHIFNIL